MGFVRTAVATAGAAALVTAGLVAGPAPAQPPAGRHPHTVTWDQYSLMIDGRRTAVWSGEFHPFRLPSPSLWDDVLEKMKAEGYNAVSLYFDWGYHSPAPGAYDFTGVRDMDRVLDDAARIGLYVIARPGPYINGEVDAGGFPGWLTTQAGRARTDAPDYLAATDEWQSRIDAILARHQLTNGTGTVLAYQIENELASTGSAERDYLDHLDAKAKADGITVPIFTNDKGRNGYWVPAGSTVPGTVPGPVDLYAFDGYPGGTCHTDGTVGGPSAAPDWGIWGPGGAKGGASASNTTPGFTAEFGGGWFDYWGSVGTYPCTAVRQGPGYERVFYETNIANRLTMQNFYMTFGGTSWGWLPAPVVYTSYDYGAAIDEARQLRPKATAMRPLGYFLASVAPILRVDAGPPVTPSNPKIKVYHDVNTQTGTQFFIATHNPGSATTDDAFTFPISTPDGDYTLSCRLTGQDAKILVANYDLGDAAHLVYSTSEIETLFPRDGGELALLYGRDGQPGQTVLRYRGAPTVRVLAGTVDSGYDAATGDLTLNYTHSGLAQVSITGGGRPPLLLLLADQATADTLWRQDTAAGAVLERGPELVRSARVDGGRLALTGDTSAAQPLEIWAPAGVHAVTWNGAPVPVRRSATGTLAARDPLPGPVPVTLPDLTKATWRYAIDSPEAQPSFDDSTWAAADKTATNSTTKPPAGAPVLTADDYGFHHGDVWYRGDFTVSGTGPATVSLRYGGGGAGLLQSWLDGTYLGQNELPNALASPPTTGTATFPVPAGLATPGPHELSVMVRDDGHNEDGGVNDAQKEGRGLISASFADAAGAPLDLAPTWKIQGNQGGEQITDTVRGAVNNGGLYGERAGWYLPGYPDSGWPTRTVPDTTAVAGTAWYRTTFPLDIPRADDASLGLTIGDPAVPHSSTAHYRALIFVNGWNMGQYVSDAGPQHTFVIPNGVLNPHGTNTVALAVTADGSPASALEPVTLTNLGTVRGGVPVTMDSSPGYAPPSVRLPGRVRAVAGAPVTETATVTVPADARGAALTATVDWGDGSAPEGLPVAAGTVWPTHTYPRPGRYRVTVRLDDRYGGPTSLASTTGTVTVSAHR